MDEDFRQYLCDYISTMMRSAGTHIQTDRAGQGLTGAQLAARMKDVSQYLKTKRYDFSSPVKMTETFAAMRQEFNSRAVEASRREYEQFVQKQDCDHENMSSCLRVNPLEMQQRLEGKYQELLEHCRGELRGEDPQKQMALEGLEQGLASKMTQFLSDYRQRYEMAETEEKNSRAVKDAREEYEEFVQEQDRDHQTLIPCLWVRSAEMQGRLEGKRQELLEHCRRELQGKDRQKQAALEELGQTLNERMEQFLRDYNQLLNKKLMDAVGEGAMIVSRLILPLFMGRSLRLLWGSTKLLGDR
ncbi:RING finger protein 112-like isoform X2 [Gopherus evgoodei]|uniref:RING finger protein 112-like isoform X2 n=1 Tax=Gopherus evgoodei TaxID=1825980 RepID=UPI0011CFB693|nr:RING finger protein 112-like isoform X2 [Gopherus evgoodei]